MCVALSVVDKPEPRVRVDNFEVSKLLTHASNTQGK